MMNKQYTAILLVVVVAAAEGNAVVAKNREISNVMCKQLKWDGYGLSADVNDYVDNTIQKLVPIIKKYGLDPLGLPDIEEGFQVRPLLITYSAWLRIHDGYMTGLMNVARTDDQMVYFFANMLRVRLNLQFTNLEFIYKYLVQVMNIGPTGGIVASLNHFVVNIDLLIDFNNDEVQLQEFSLTDIGHLRVRLTGNILIDWLVNPVVGVFVRIFDTTIIKFVEKSIRSTVQDVISFINSEVRDIIQIIESFQ